MQERNWTLPQSVVNFSIGTLKKPALKFIDMFPNCVQTFSADYERTLVLITSSDIFLQDEDILPMRDLCRENGISRVVNIPRIFSNYMYHTSNVVGGVCPSISLTLLRSSVAQWMDYYPLCFFDIPSEEEQSEWSLKWNLTFPNSKISVVLGTEIHCVYPEGMPSDVAFCPGTAFPLVFRHTTHTFSCLCKPENAKEQYRFGLLPPRIGYEGTLVCSPRYLEEKAEKHSVCHRTIGGALVIDNRVVGVTAGHFLAPFATLVAYSPCFDSERDKNVGNKDLQATSFLNMWDVENEEVYDIALLDLNKNWGFDLERDLLLPIKGFDVCGQGMRQFFPNIFILGARYEHCVCTYIKWQSHAEPKDSYMSEDQWDLFRNVLINYRRCCPQDHLGQHCFKRQNGDDDQIKKTISCQYLTKVDDDLDLGGNSGSLCFIESNLNWGCAGIQSGSLKDTKPQNYCFIQPLDMVDHLAGALLTCSAAESIWMSYVNRIRRFSGEEFIVHPNYIPVIGSSSVRLFSTISRSSNQSVSTSPCLIDLDGLRPAFRQAWSECQTFSQYVRHATIDHENEEIRLLSRLFPAYFLANDHLYLVSLLPGIYPNELDLIQLPVIVSFAFLGASLST